MIFFCDMEEKKIKIYLIIIIVLILLAFASRCHAIFGIDTLFKKTNDVYNNQQTIAEQNKKIFEDIATVKNNSITAKAFSDFKNEIKTDIRAEFKAQASANVGIGNKLEEIDKSIRVQGDMITNTNKNTQTSIVNDPLTWQLFSAVLSSIILFLLRDTRANRIWLQNMIESKKKEEVRADIYKEKWMKSLKVNWDESKKDAV